MPGTPARYGAADPSQPAVHELRPLSWGGGAVPVHLEVRRGEDGTWRGRLLFGPLDDREPSLATADIFCADSEADLWECVGDLRDHHLRDLYRSLAE